MSAIRAFVALPLGEDLRGRISRTVAGLQACVQGIRWTSWEGWHLTLRFLGAASPGVLASMEAPLRSAAARCPAGDACFAGLGTFPQRGAPRVLWLGVSLHAEFVELQSACEAAAVAAGFPPETRAFHPHVTLGRWRDGARRPRFPPADLGAGRLDELVLFRSDSTPSGAVYSPLASFPLKR